MRSRRRPLLRVGLVMLIATSIICVLVWQSIAKSNSSQITQKPNPAITVTSNTPIEAAKSQTGYEWLGPGSYPKTLRIPSINVDTYIQNMGIDQLGQIAAPTDISLAGWFINSAKPGEPGLSIIDGHVNGRTNPNGVFKLLSSLKLGAIFSITRGDNTVISYRVISNQTLPLAKVPDVLYSQSPTIKSQLNLITCGGNFDREINQYNSRTVISAEVVQH